MFKLHDPCLNGDGVKRSLLLLPELLLLLLLLLFLPPSLVVGWRGLGRWWYDQGNNKYDDDVEKKRRRLLTIAMPWIVVALIMTDDGRMTHGSCFVKLEIGMLLLILVRLAGS